MEDQVLSIGQMRHLAELCLDVSSATMYWRRGMERKDGEDKVLYDWVVTRSIFGRTTDSPNEWNELFYAFTLQDVLALLPSEIQNTEGSAQKLYISKNKANDWFIYYSYSSDIDGDAVFNSFSLINAAYAMLCWCIENGYVETNKEKPLNDVLDNTAVRCKTEEEAKECVRIFFGLGIKWTSQNIKDTYWDLFKGESCYAKRKYINELCYGIESHFIANSMGKYQVIPFKQFKELIKQKTL